MSAGLRALLAGAIDYAGLFPPASLPLDQAVRNYARYRTTPESWMLGRFICPATRLRELAPYRSELFESGPPLLVAVLGSGGNDAAAFLAGLRADLDALAAFRDVHSQRIVVDVLEVRLPTDVFTSPDRLSNLLADAADLIESYGPPVLTPYYEAAAGPLAAVIIALTHDAKSSPSRTRSKCRSAGFKLRCGGLEAAAFPSPGQIASVIVCCRDAGIALKFTAGLHHPLRHFDPDLHTYMHGFLNVLGAGVLAHARHLSEDQVRSMVEDENALDFVLDDEGLRWQGYRATCEEIAAARQRAVASFGSCSFDEPRDDLRALGLLK